MGRDIVGQEAASTHPGIDGEMNGQFHSTFFGDEVEGQGFIHGGDAGSDVAGDDFLTFLIPCCSEEVDGCVDSGVADTSCFADIGDTEECDLG